MQTGKAFKAIHFEREAARMASKMRREHDHATLFKRALVEEETRLYREFDLSWDWVQQEWEEKVRYLKCYVELIYA